MSFRALGLRFHYLCLLFSLHLFFISFFISTIFRLVFAFFRIRISTIFRLVFAFFSNYIIIIFHMQAPSKHTVSRELGDGIEKHVSCSHHVRMDADARLHRPRISSTIRHQPH